MYMPQLIENPIKFGQTGGKCFGFYFLGSILTFTKQPNFIIMNPQGSDYLVC